MKKTVPSILGSLLLILVILNLPSIMSVRMTKISDSECESKESNLLELKCYVEKAIGSSEPRFCLNTISDRDLSLFCFSVVEKLPDYCSQIEDDGLEIECFRKLGFLPDPYIH